MREEAHLGSKQVSSESEDTVSFPAAEAAIQWLDHNSQPWTTALDKWELSYPIRKKQLGNKILINDLYRRYQLYREEYGYQAVSIMRIHVTKKKKKYDGYTSDENVNRSAIMQCKSKLDIKKITKLGKDLYFVKNEYATMNIKIKNTYMEPTIHIAYSLQRRSMIPY